MKRYLANEKGAALLMVMLMLTMFSILGLAVLNAALSGATRTEFNEGDSQTVQEARKAVQQGAAILQTYFEGDSLLPLANYNDEIKKFDNLTLEYESGNDKKKIDYTIRNITDEYGKIKTDKDYTRVFEISATVNDPELEHERTFLQKAILSATPTALQQAVGAAESLILNGSANITGNMFARELAISKDGFYEYGSGSSVSYPTFSTNEVSHLSPMDENEYAVLTIMNDKLETKLENEEDYVVENMPEEKYQAIDVEETYNDIRNKLPSDDKLTCLTVDEDGNVYMEPTTEAVGLLSPQCPNIPDELETFSIFGASIPENMWIIVDGSLNIVGEAPDAAESPMISANFLISDDVYITGNLRLASTIYALGNAEIHEANILGMDNKSLALFAKENLIVSRINEFESPSLASGELHAFLYSEEDINLYAVGSYMNIIGGIFSSQNLTINAARGEASRQAIEAGNNLGVTVGDPRLIIKHDPDLIFNAGANELPRVKKLHVFTEGLREVK